MIVICAWLLCGLLAAVMVRFHDDGINLLSALFLMACGPPALLIVFIFWLSEIEI
jgi:hypothetical protein